MLLCFLRKVIPTPVWKTDCNAARVTMRPVGRLLTFLGQGVMVVLVRVGERR